MTQVKYPQSRHRVGLWCQGVLQYRQTTDLAVFLLVAVTHELGWTGRWISCEEMSSFLPDPDDTGQVKGDFRVLSGRDDK